MSSISCYSCSSGRRPRTFADCADCPVTISRCSGPSAARASGAARPGAGFGCGLGLGALLGPGPLRPLLLLRLFGPLPRRPRLLLLLFLARGCPRPIVASLIRLFLALRLFGPGVLALLALLLFGSGVLALLAPLLLGPGVLALLALAVVPSFFPDGLLAPLPALLLTGGVFARAPGGPPAGGGPGGSASVRPGAPSASGVRPWPAAWLLCCARAWRAPADCRSSGRGQRSSWRCRAGLRHRAVAPRRRGASRPGCRPSSCCARGPRRIRGRRGDGRRPGGRSSRPDATGASSRPSRRRRHRRRRRRTVPAPAARRRSRSRLRSAGSPADWSTSAAARCTAGRSAGWCRRPSKS